MIQSLAILQDAYRELNSKRLFWFTMLISGLVVGIVAALGNDEKGLKILHWSIELPIFSTNFIPASEFHKLLFVNLGLSVWLSWIAMILALISTAGMFPEFLAGGAIELSLSKPIGRLRLFLTKYAAGLLFVGLQVTVFTLASFFVIGLRGGVWEPAVLLAIPLVVLVFSFLFSVCVLVGTLWRSTIAALLITLIVWGLIFMLNSADFVLLMVREEAAMRLESRTQRVEDLRRTIDERETGASAGVPRAEAPVEPPPEEGGIGARLRWAMENARDAAPEGEPIERLREQLKLFEERRDESAKNHRAISRWHFGIFAAKTVLPKTTETIALMERYIIDLGRMEALRAENETSAVRVDMATAEDETPISDEQSGPRVEKIIRARTEWWVIGTSLAFECVMVGLAAWIFCRRDF